MPPPQANRAALSIAGSDPTGGAGLQLDLQVFALHGVHGMAVPTALTVQNTTGVKTALPAFPHVVGDQLEFLLHDLRPDAIKIGMLGTDDILLRVAHILRHLDVPIVLDPVLRSSNGAFLLERRGWENLVSELVPLAALVTPNLSEAELLTGEAEPEKAARVLLEAGARAVLVKGGHATGDPDDLLATPGESVWLRGTRQSTEPVHGTGCALSSAIAARLARGEPLTAAVREAKSFVERAIANAFRLGSGQLLLGFS
jgi:hydroxymethylpyrimidine/phosphomethylpyrimidine kinase